MLTVPCILLRPLPSLTSPKEAAYKQHRKCKPSVPEPGNTFPSPLAGVVLAWSWASGEENERNKSSGEHGIPLPFIFLILQTPHSANPMPVKLLDQSSNSSGSFREEMSGLAKNLSGNWWQKLTLISNTVCSSQQVSSNKSKASTSEGCLVLRQQLFAVLFSC